MYLCSCEVLINAVALEQSEKKITEMYETHRLSFFSITQHCGHVPVLIYLSFALEMYDACLMVKVSL